MIARENFYAAGFCAAGMVLGCSLFAAVGPVKAAQPLPAVTVTSMITVTAVADSHTDEAPERASRSSVRIPPHLGNDVETPRFLCAKPKPHTPGQRHAIGFVKSCRQWVCLVELWDRESGWSPTSLGARTKHGRAYGIAQSMGMKPGTPMKTQVRLGLKYVKHRYGTPCRALAAHDRKGWY